MPVDERFDELTAIEFIVIVGIMHFEVMKLQLLISHFTSVHWNGHVLCDVSVNKEIQN